MFRLLPAWLHDRQGSVTVTLALVMTALIGFACVSIDAASYYNVKRHQQTATDLAALAAAANVANANTLAANAAVANGFRSSDISAIESGVYTADAALQPGQRFTPSTVGANAVRVTMRTTPPFIFGSALQTLMGATRTGGFLVRTQATASSKNTAAFGIGTGVAQLNAGLLNSLLGAFLGSSVSLSALDYENLTNADIDLFSFSDALATKVHATALSYGSLLGLSTSQNDIFAAFGTVTQGTVAATTVNNLLAQLAGRTSSPLTLAQIISFGPYGLKAVQTTHPVTAQVSAMDLLFALAKLSASGQTINSALNVSLPGIASVQATLVIGQPGTTVSFETVGPLGTVLKSSQVRVLLNIQLIGSGVASVVNLPVYLEVAPGMARLASLTCPTSTVGGSVGLGVTPGLADAWIGSPQGSSMAVLSSPPPMDPAVLLNIPLLAKVTATAHAAIQNVNETLVSFSTSDIANGTKKTTSTTNYLTSLTASLFNSLSINVNVLGLGVGANGLGSLVGSIVTGAAPSIDTLLSTLLADLGVSVGTATTWTSGFRCGQAGIVN